MLITTKTNYQKELFSMNSITLEERFRYHVVKYLEKDGKTSVSIRFALRNAYKFHLWVNQIKWIV